VDVLNTDNRVVHSSDTARAAQSVSKFQTVTIKLVATLGSIGSYFSEWMMQGLTYEYSQLFSYVFTVYRGQVSELSADPSFYVLHISEQRLQIKGDVQMSNS
jgi:hypothetical protein